MELKETLYKVADCRVEGRCLHIFADILGLVLGGVIADCDGFDEKADYKKDNIDFLRQKLEMSFADGVPSADTLKCVLRYLCVVATTWPCILELSDSCFNVYLSLTSVAAKIRGAQNLSRVK